VRLVSALAFLRRAWHLAGPYWRSEERWRARVLIFVIVVLTLALVFLSVLYNNWNRMFFEAIQNKDFAAFGTLLLQLAILTGLYIIGAVFRLYFTMMLQMRWRIWLTQQFLDRWLRNQVFYRLELLDRRTDNPDQRIAEDLRLFAFNSLDLTLGLLSSLVTLVSFVAILWAIGGSFPLSFGAFAVDIPGYMVWVALLYALGGSGLTHLVGRPLIPLNFQQQRVEADLRFGLVRLRENAEGVALYRGQGVERVDLTGRIGRIRGNWWQLMRITKNLTFLTTGYDQLAGVFPLLVAAPRYFTGAITLGVLSQIGDAFGQVQGSLSWFVESYGSLASWKATVDRLLTFEEAMNLVEAESGHHAGIEIVANGAHAIRTDHLDVALPDGRVILRDTNLTFGPRARVLISGPTGAGKSTLFRALAGIWPFGTGQVEVPSRARLLFLPQRAYLPVASVRETVSYPAPAGTFDDETVRTALRDTGLDTLAEHLDDVQNWSNRLSGGEQQRLAIARALLHQPDWLFLDEATAALDETAERHLYELLTDRLPNTAIISIAHRPGVSTFHDTHLTLSADTLQPARQANAVADG
jgi:putative ATP-binding cassette transporter